MMKNYKTIDEYISIYPTHIQVIFKKIRSIVKELAPKAEETISYGIPTFKLNGNLIHFAAYDKHIGFYPGPEAIKVFKKHLEEYSTSKGAVRFPLDRPIPYALIKRIVKFRVKTNQDQYMI